MTLAVTPRDVFFSDFDRRIVYRLTPDPAHPGQYVEPWDEPPLIPGNPIGMADDGKFLYVATWSGHQVYKVNMTTGVRDLVPFINNPANDWALQQTDLNQIGDWTVTSTGDLESLTVRKKNNRTYLVLGFADEMVITNPFGSSPPAWIAEYDITDGTPSFVAAYFWQPGLEGRGADWVWMVDEDHLVTGNETATYWWFNMNTQDFGPFFFNGDTSYSIEIRGKTVLACNGNSGPLQVWTWNGHFPTSSPPAYSDAGVKEFFVSHGNINTYFASTLEYDGKWAWISNYSGQMPDGSTSVWRINTTTGEGKDQPIYFFPNGPDIQGIYSPDHIIDSVPPPLRLSSRDDQYAPPGSERRIGAANHSTSGQVNPAGRIPQTNVYW